MSLALDERRSAVSKVEAFRAHANECRQQAQWSLDPADKERWLEIAEKWLQITREVEEEVGFDL
jgi:hypothetical protein